MGEIVRNQFLDFILVYPKRHYYDKERESIFFRTDSTCFDGAEWSGWSYKAKDFFLGKLSCQHFGFSIGFEIEFNWKLITIYLYNIYEINPILFLTFEWNCYQEILIQIDLQINFSGQFLASKIWILNLNAS